MILRPATGVGFFRTIYYGLRENGWRGSLRQLCQMGEMRVGTLRGTDEFGNRYYENTKYQFARDRWVEYANLWHYDMSQVPAAWYGWLSHMTDMVPEELAEAVRTVQTNRIVEKSDAIYDSNVGLVQERFTENQTYFRPRGYKVEGYNDGWGAHPEVVNSHDLRISNQLHPEFEMNEDQFSEYEGKLGDMKDKKLTTGPHKQLTDLSEEF